MKPKLWNFSARFAVLVEVAGVGAVTKCAAAAPQHLHRWCRSLDAGVCQLLAGNVMCRCSPGLFFKTLLFKVTRIRNP